MVSVARVAPLAGSVDRNGVGGLVFRCEHVAPLAGSVDRNAGSYLARDGFQRVAPLAGSVDRNVLLEKVTHRWESRSPRGERG